MPGKTTLNNAAISCCFDDQRHFEKSEHTDDGKSSIYEERGHDKKSISLLELPRYDGDGDGGSICLIRTCSVFRNVNFRVGEIVFVALKIFIDIHEG